MTKEQEFINDICNEYDNNSRATKTLAHTIAADIEQGLSGAKYINELLQNADDAGIDVNHSIEVEIVLTSNYLIFKHNGNHFSKKDVDAIADCANTKRDKLNELQAIGHKGRGFKAVFSMTDYVLIVSNQWQFRFSKQHWGKPAKDLPWQLMPIWTNSAQFADEIKSHINAEQVCFVFKLRNNRENIKAQIMHYFENPKLMLFLKRTNALSFFDVVANEEEKLIYNKEKINNQVENVTAQINGEEVAQWYIYTTQCSLTKNLKTTLKKQDNIPQKYKTLDKTPLMMTFETDGDTLITATEPAMACYLFTEINYGFKAILNAEFFLEPSRVHLQTNDTALAWNAFLIAHFFFYQLNFLAYISEHTELWRDVLTNLTLVDDVNFGALNHKKDSFQKLLEQAIKKIPFLKSTSDTLLNADNCWIDEHGFIEHFGSDTLKAKTIHRDIKDKEVALKFGAKHFGFENIITEIKKPAFLKTVSTYENNRDFIECIFSLYGKLSKSEKTELTKLLKETKFILSTDNQMLLPEEIYFPDESVKYYFADFDHICLVHMTISNIKDKKCLSWLKTLGVQVISLDLITQLTNKNSKNLDILLTRLYEKHCNNKLSEKDYLSAKKLYLQCMPNNVYMAAEHCHLADNYQPEHPLQNVLPNYFYVEDKEDINAWKAFFIKIGVNETITASNIEAIINTANKLENEALIKFTAYIMRIFDELQSEVVKITSEKLLFLSHDNQKTEAKQLYLSNQYNPKIPLQKHVEELKYISNDYFSGDNKADSIQPWHDFFIALGIAQEPKIESHYIFYPEKVVRAFPYQKPDTNNHLAAYLYFLKEEVQLDHAPDIGTNLAPSQTFRYYKQHYLSFFLDIQFIHHIIKTPYFWQMLNTIYKKHKNNLSHVTYSTAMSKRKVPSSLEYYVHLAIQHHYDCTPEQIYSPKLTKLFGNYIQTADIAKKLKKDVLEFCKFKTWLSIDDCYNILVKLAEKPFDQKTFNKITEVYKHLIYQLKNNPNQSHEFNSLKLLNQLNQFTASDELFYINTKLTLQPSQNMIKRPSNISNEDFKLICDVFSIEVIDSKELNVNFKRSKNDSDLVTLLNDKLPYLAVFEAHNNNIVSNGFSKFYRPFVNEISNKLDELKIILVKELSIKHEEKFRQSCTIWFDEDATTIYLQEQTKDNIYTTQHISEILKNYFCLTSASKDITGLLSSNVDTIKLNNPQLDFSLLDTLNDEEYSDISMEEASESDTSTDEEVTFTPARDKSQASSSSSASYQSYHTSTTGKRKAPIKPAVKRPKQQSIPKWSSLSKEERNTIGLNGEQVVYDHLYKKYHKKHGKQTISDTETGFEIKKDNYAKQIIWPNKGIDPAEVKATSRKKYDIKIKTFNNGIKKSTKIEVKSTRHQDEITADFSPNEWELWRKQTDTKKYRLFFVANVGAQDKKPIIRKIKNIEELKPQEFKRVFYDFNKT